MFIKILFSDPQMFFTLLVLVVFSICLHEYCHALVAYKCGDPTAADNGHLTLNPMKQMGLLSLVMLCFIGFAWGQIPVNQDNLKTKSAKIFTALAGPAANFMLSIVFAALGIAGMLANANMFAVNMIFYGSVYNMMLTIFNLLPVPGLDGWNILRIFWKGDLNTTPEFVKGIFLILVMLLFTFFNYIFSAAEHSVRFLVNLMLKLGGLA